jgi:hypothetical protein
MTRLTTPLGDSSEPEGGGALRIRVAAGGAALSSAVAETTDCSAPLGFVSEPAVT